MEYFGYIASFAMGIVLGLMGAGGSILTIPILVYLFGVPPTLATSYSLFVVGATALVGSIIAIRKGEVNFRTTLSFAIASIIGVNISRSIIIPSIPVTIAQIGSFVLTKETLIMVLFAILMTLASYSMIKRKTPHKSIRMQLFKQAVFMAIQGLIVGILVGFVGAGGGFLIIPVLIFMGGLSMKTAVSTSLLIITIQSLLGFGSDIFRGQLVDWSILTAVATIAIFGIIVGSRFTNRFDEQNLKYIFGWMILIMGITILAEQLLYLKT